MTSMISCASWASRASRSLHEQRPHASRGLWPLALRLLELVRLRCSAVNGCDFCIAMHRKKAREAGLSAAEVVAIQSLGEEPIFCRDERLILELCDAVTRLADAQALRGVVDALQRSIGALQTVEVLYAIAQINAWNRLAIAGGLGGLVESDLVP